MRAFSAEAREQLTEPWEECVLYVYDDKVPKRRIGGRLVYPEWDGGAVRGTLTIGWGHTDAAGGPKIHQGMRITQAEADEILSADLAPVVRQVNRALRVEVTQHQFDTLVDLAFNCFSALRPVAALINAGNLRAVPARLMQYTFSKGEHMQGLVNRRAAEIRFWNTPDAPEEAEVEELFSPKAERDPPPGTMATSKTGAAAATIGAGGVVEVLQGASDALEPVRQVKGTLDDIGLVDMLHHAAHSPAAIVGAVIVVLAVFVWLDRRYKLVNWHV
jgi:GH24 family phage-related lysozyme (muramidase)